MGQLLLEFLSEEIPARMQKRAEEDLARLIGEALGAAGFPRPTLRTLSGPRRLALIAEGLPPRTPDVNEERKGPRVGAPPQAIAGFLKAAGLARIEDAAVVKDAKGDFYMTRVVRDGRGTAELIADIVPRIARDFPWPKSMRSGASDFVWVRPLHKILCVYDAAAVVFEIGGIRSGNQTEGHRFHAPAWISVKNAAEYETQLRAAYVLVDRDTRKARILTDARAACAARGLELVEDGGLLEEVAGLAEWPVVVLGDMDPAFLDLPAEVIRLTMRTHQRYFAVRAPGGVLAPHFIAIANIEAKDGGGAIAAGNARVLSARLNDARFFWDADRKTPLGSPERAERLKQIVFHQKLGTVADKVERVRALACALAPFVGADPALADRAALLAKADLVTETVGEFPELQGQIGRQLAELDGENHAVAVAVEDHYRPVGPNDRVPSDPVALAVALADKLDTLAAFWAIDEKPTGSRDPYALRRAALGVVRILLERKIRASVAAMIALTRPLIDQHDRPAGSGSLGHAPGAVEGDLLQFLAERLRVQLRDQGRRHDLVDAVFAVGDDDFVRIVQRAEALETFLKTEDGANLLAGYKRAANILKAEEKKDPALARALALDMSIPAGALRARGEPAEQALHQALEALAPKAHAAAKQENFTAAMGLLAQLRGPVDRFLTEVLVNSDDRQERLNRLKLLAGVRDALDAVADFSRIEG